MDIPVIFADAGLTLTLVLAIGGLLASLAATLLKEFISRFRWRDSDRKITVKVQGRTIELSVTDRIEFEQKVDALLESLPKDGGGSEEARSSPN